MGKSYPDRTNATGIWKLSDIYKNKITHGTYPGSYGGDRCIVMGGWAPGGATNYMDFFSHPSSKRLEYIEFQNSHHYN